MKKLARNNFSKPEIKTLSIKNSEISTQYITNNKTEESNLQFDKTELASEIEKWKQSKNSTTDITKFRNYPNINEFNSNFEQLPQHLAETQKNAIMSRINQEKYNSWKQITLVKKDKIDNELEKQQRKDLIMNQLENLKREKEAQQKLHGEISENKNHNKKPVVLNLSSNLASKKIMMKISSFVSQTSNIWTKEQKKLLNKYISLFFDWLEVNDESIKNFMSESIAQVILYLVSCNIGISKTDFINNLKPDVKTNRNKPKIENIKKLLCYPLLKGAFKTVLENAQQCS